MTSRPTVACAGPVTTIVCPNGTHKYSPETMGKGYYEVIGQLQSGQIMEMTSVYMGDNFGARHRHRVAACPESPAAHRPPSDA